MSNLHTCITPNTTIQELSTQDLDNCSGGRIPEFKPPDYFGDIINEFFGEPAIDVPDNEIEWEPPVIVGTLP
jgi:hypothetical protein